MSKQDLLQAYMDTGLTPEEITTNMEMFAAYRHVCGGKSPEEVAQMSAENARLRAERDKAVEVVRCKDCRWRDKQLCRAAKSVKYDLHREKHIYKTLMEPDGFCSIGESGTEGRGKRNE